MPRTNLRITADRLRRVGDTLSRADQEIIRKYADELEALARCEVVAPTPIAVRGSRDEIGAAVLASALKRVFPVDRSTPFDGLLCALLEKEQGRA